MFYTNAFEDYENVGLGLDSLQSSKGSSIFGESLRVAPRSSVKASKGKNASLVTKCEIGDSLVSVLVLDMMKGFCFFLCCF